MKVHREPGKEYLHVTVTPLLTQTGHPFPSQAPKPITVVSDTAVVKREGSSVFPRTLLLLFWFQQISRLKELICTSCSHYSVQSFQGRMCLHLYLSNSKLQVSSNEVLNGAVKVEVSTGTSDGLPTVIILLFSVFPRCDWAVLTVETLRNSKPSVLLFYFL